MTSASNPVSPASRNSQPYRIVLTGGPGGGKTTAADLFRREIGDSVVVVPEAATMLFSGGFPRAESEDGLAAVQHAIYHVQRNLEDVQAARYPDRILLCDRGTVDGAAYWPGGGEAFFESLGTSLEEELERYDAVLFFETAAAGQISIEGGNPIRTESLSEALSLDQHLRRLWSQHPHFHLVRHANSFFKKITFGLAHLESLVGQFQDGNGTDVQS
ncbi:AAA family ATPase [Sulfidibacter corallicola]|uniref:AAA family ATPase n=1 Tax=Sulfidibacter corallicola TaxID=2818388 RepID=A0A8A4TFL4_SULCO|nr:AAA family ATPase [Sulfidibacter corallicola]QTD47541.1 AAA family ATPase [Sulfidibacter corallicola]